METTARRNSLSLGAIYLGDGRCRFEVWAPRAERVEVHFVAPSDRVVALRPCARGYHRSVIDGVEPGCKYFYRLNGNERPDPASRCQPQGVHGPSEIVARDFAWHDQNWFGLPLKDYIIYELHVGAFTPEST